MPGFAGGGAFGCLQCGEGRGVEVGGGLPGRVAAPASARVRDLKLPSGRAVLQASPALRSHWIITAHSSPNDRPLPQLPATEGELTGP